MRSNASIVEEYLTELPEGSREAIDAVRQIILEHLPEGYAGMMDCGTITHEVPLETYSDTYNKKPLMYPVLAAQKNYLSVYLTAIYTNEEAS